MSKGDRITEQIVIGTPGSVLDWVLKKKVFDPMKLKLFVLDEADIMIATQGHQDQTIRIHKLVLVQLDYILSSHNSIVR